MMENAGLSGHNKKTIVVNRRLEPYDVYVGRGSPLGNPYPVHNGEFTLEDSLNNYKYDFYRKLKKEEGFKEYILSLKGKKLGCYCKKKVSTDPKFELDKTPCHADIIANYLNNEV